MTYTTSPLAGQKRTRDNPSYLGISGAELNRLHSLPPKEQTKEAIRQMEVFAQSLPRGTNFLPPAWYSAKAWRVDDDFGHVRPRRMMDDMMDNASKRRCAEQHRPLSQGDDDDNDDNDNDDKNTSSDEDTSSSDDEYPYEEDEFGSNESTDDGPDDDGDPRSDKDGSICRSSSQSSACSCGSHDSDLDVAAV